MNVVICLDKPAHITSQQAVVKVKRLLGARKAGHAGTLDPLATGILLVCLDEATKITRFLADLDKEYVVQMKLGERTDTYDSTGRILETRNPGFLQKADVEGILDRYTGSIHQIPPMYSAVKIGGTPLYKLARKGISVERQERDVVIHEAELLSYDPPYVNVRIACSKGTYIRTLCDDVGNALGTGAHMTSLIRSRVGNFRLEDALSLSELSEKKDSFYQMDECLSHLEEIQLDSDSWQKVRNGVPVDLYRNNTGSSCELPKGEICGISSKITRYVRLKSPDRTLVGIGLLENDCLQVERLFNFSER
jgi:tRNA pseudouridine55 synthase